jgi:hypothetical protein
MIPLWLLILQSFGEPFWDESHDFEGWFLVGSHYSLALSQRNLIRDVVSNALCSAMNVS